MASPGSALHLYAYYDHKLPTYDTGRIQSILRSLQHYFAQRSHIPVVLHKNCVWQEKNHDMQSTCVLIFVTPFILRITAIREQLAIFFEKHQGGQHPLVLTIAYRSGLNHTDTLWNTIQKSTTLSMTHARFYRLDHPIVQKIVQHIQNHIEQRLQPVEQVHFQQVWRSIQQTDRPTGNPILRHPIRTILQRTTHHTILTEYQQTHTPHALVKHPTNAFSVPSLHNQSCYRPSSIAIPRNYVLVDERGHGDCTTLQEALDSCQNGTKILINPGSYEGSFVIAKRVHIVGNGSRQRVCLFSRTATVLICQCEGACFENLSIEQRGATECYAIDIGVVSPRIVQCDIVNQHFSCIAIHDGANPVIDSNWIHGSCVGSGLLIFHHGRGQITHNRITTHVHAGIEVSSLSQPYIANNQICDNTGGGLLFYDEATGTVENNLIAENRLANIQIESAAHPHLLGNRIEYSHESGIFIKNGGRGQLERNDVHHNAYAGISLESGSEIVCTDNSIHNNGYVGVWIYNGGRGHFENNDLRGNKQGAWNISGDSILSRKNNKE